MRPLRIRVTKMIADVMFKNKQYVVFNEQGKEIANGFESDLGNLVGFTDSFILFEKKDRFFTVDDRLKEIASEWKNTVGEFRNAAGHIVNFTKNKQIYTRDTMFKEISRRFI